MTCMVRYLGWRRVVQCQFPSECSQNVLSADGRVMLGMQHSNLERSNTAGLHYAARCPRRLFIAVAGSSVKQDALLPLSTVPDSSFSEGAAANTYYGSYTVAALEIAPPNTRPYSSKIASIQNKLSSGRPSLDGPVPQTDDKSIAECSTPLTIMCLECLELSGYHLKKCLRHSGSVDVEELRSVLKNLSFYGFERKDLKDMFVKFPSFVQVSDRRVSQFFQYFLSLGLPKNIIVSLLLKRPALISYDLKRAGEVVDYFFSLGITKEDLVTILERRPHVIEHDVQIIKEIVKFFMEANFDKFDINQLIKRAPTVFTLPIESIKDSLKFWFNVVGMESKDLFRAILRRPNFLSYNIQSMFHTHNYLQAFIEPTDLRKSVCRFAELLSYDPQTKLKPLINYFLEFGLSQREVAKVIYRRPQIMSCTVERLEKVTSFLRDLGLEDEAVAKILLQSPQVFTLNAEDKLKRGIEFFQSMGLDKEKDIEYVFTRCAQIFCCSIEKNLVPTFRFLSNLGLEKESLSKMITGFPSILGHNANLSLAPKYEFLISDMKRPAREVVEFPQYFGYSLEGRIKPRHKLLAERGLCISLASMLACTDKDFYARYLEPCGPLLQDSSFLKRSNPVQKMHANKPQSRKKCTFNASRSCQSKQRREEISPFEKQLVASHQEKKSMEARPEIFADCAMNDSWDCLDSKPNLKQQQEQLYPTYFNKLFKNRSPCGMWIHAYRFDM